MASLVAQLDNCSLPIKLLIIALALLTLMALFVALVKLLKPTSIAFTFYPLRISFKLPQPPDTENTLERTPDEEEGPQPPDTGRTPERKPDEEGG
ncbi:Hexosyltransferase [Psidium guajava]|nr:Hexosyltransferase [Psidium guajava]